MSKRRSTGQGGRRKPDRAGGLYRGWFALAGAIVGTLLLATAVWLYNRYLAPAPTFAPGSLQPGTANYCRAMPPFALNQGFSQQSFFSTSERRIEGLILIDGSELRRGATFQHPSWSAAGSLGPIQLDGSGNAYVAPVPTINVLDNSADRQNTIYRVDGANAEMKAFVTIPPVQAPDDSNPYGILGLSYDCDTRSLYATTVAGSTRLAEVGEIVRIDAANATGVVADTFTGVDAIGLAAWNAGEGKRLLYGKARSSEIWSIALDGRGGFNGEPRLEFTLAGLGPRGDDKARRIVIDSATQLTVYGIEFSYNLIAPSEKQQTAYTFALNASSGKWEFVPAAPDEQ